MLDDVDKSVANGASILAVFTRSVYIFGIPDANLDKVSTLLRKTVPNSIINVYTRCIRFDNGLGSRH